MSIRHIYKHRLVAEIDMAVEYDPNSPASFTAALEKVAAVRKGLTDTGAALMKDAGKPVVVRD